ncbi:beta-ketoacyl-ACP synthase III [Alkalilimnicola sp. S0819]|uniref:beta-ketoacyl-ACP synthase III n=1 Tax=Alkalilimnicola sp. S0819 TaxID=2613922 RepID=UPI001261A541|nr:beta-ketoacyl-ACP synthase III [Alkalilimnicola sp. S0819]KAB7624163.1 beta-ketoacyl-ACP synthase III [Alkalilimnicola sp. S0819]MPQ16416.1 StlD/DarB family beta-ketosynthase [Alkalilimnicola sp. S0819]
MSYITRISAFLPGEPIDNDTMESVLGLVGGKPSRARKVVLRSNGIQTRHYVIDPATGKPRYSNAELTAEAVRKLAEQGADLNGVDLLAAGTSTPDQILPSHGVMVHGALGNPPCEVVSPSGVCASSALALKYAHMAVSGGFSQQAVAAGSEVVSTFMQGKNFQAESDKRLAAMERHPEIAFEKDFLRWMLSDGAGAAELRPEPNAQGLSLRIDWIEQLSYANELDACMYAGARKEEDGRLTGWRELAPQAWLDESIFAVKQDVRLLNPNVMPVTVSRGLADMLKKHPLRVDEVDWFLPHYSSHYFRQKVYDALVAIDFEIPEARWFTNLERVGNVGAASMYMMLDELFHSGRIRDGDGILCYVPESGRFTSVFMKLTAVVR